MEDQLLKLKGNLPRYDDNHGYKLHVIPNNSVIIFEPSTVASPLFRKRNRASKRTFDIIISLTAIIFLLTWMLPLLALLIKISSPGPVFFIQKRAKKNGKLFHCIKLRTMIVNDNRDKLTAVLNDKRITRLGKFLRKSHLDELPQFINVFMGDMSIVGPRPHMIAENQKFTNILSFYNHRHLVKPGITGLAQSFGYHGPVIDMPHLNKKIAYDIFYIKYWSVMMDVKIMVRTIGMIFKKLKPAR